MARGGYGYVVSETLKEDIFISQNNLNHALDGDTVKVLVYAHKKSRNHWKVKWLKFLRGPVKPLWARLKFRTRYAFLVS